MVDADERRLSFLKEAAAREQLALETVHHDLRRPLPAGLLRAFDVIETDPPYTLEGARLFLARGCEALAAGADGHCFFSFTHWPASQMLELQKVFTELGLAVRAIWPNFNRYAGASMLGNLGQLIELIHVGGAAAELPDFSGPLYTAEINPRLRVYACADCGKEIVLGRGRDSGHHRRRQGGGMPLLRRACVPPAVGSTVMKRASLPLALRGVNEYQSDGYETCLKNQASACAPSRRRISRPSRCSRGKLQKSRFPTIRSRTPISTSRS